MQKIVFINNSPPALNSTNLNQLQDNVEEAIENVIQSGTELPQTAEEGTIFLLYTN